MRVYLDTNIIAFLVGRDRGESISRDVFALINDYGTLLYVSSVCVQELIHLIQIGKVRIPGFNDIRYAADEALRRMTETGIAIKPVTEQHIRTLIGLPLYDNHRDPNDRMIVAQAIADHIPLVSSDRKFTMYERYGLQLIVNER